MTTYTTVELIENNFINLDDQDTRTTFAAFITDDEDTALWELINGQWEVVGFEDMECPNNCCICIPDEVF